MKVRNLFSQEITMAAIFLFMIVFTGCAAGPGASTRTGQLWRGKVSGDATGVIEVNMYQNPDQQGAYTISGFIKADVVGGAAGPAKADLSIKGNVVDGVLRGRLSGSVGAVSITTTAAGEITGHLSATTGEGSYHARATEFGMHFQGKWTIERVR